MYFIEPFQGNLDLPPLILVVLSIHKIKSPSKILLSFPSLQQKVSLYAK
jgi:hypothetical protein